MRCSIQQPRCRCVSAIFFARVSQHCRDTTKSDRRTPFPEAFIAIIRHQKMFAFVIHSETQSVVTHLFLPWRGIVGDWRQQHRFSVPLQTHMLRDAVSLQFAKTTPAISQIGVRGVFVCEGVASVTTSASILLGKRKKVDLRLLVSIGCVGCSAVPQSGICFAWEYCIRISRKRFVDDSLLCSWLYDLLVASKCCSVVQRNAGSGYELFPAKLECGRSMLEGFSLSLASTSGEGLIPFRKPRMLAGMFRLPWRFVCNSTSNKLVSRMRAVVMEHGMMFSCVLL